MWRCPTRFCLKREGEAPAEPYITGRARLGRSLALPNLSESRVLRQSQGSFESLAAVVSLPETGLAPFG
jgi:hypothetical protein